MKRILHIVGKMDRAGAETMVMNLYRAIDRNKFQFDFLSFSNKKGDFDDEIESLGGKIYRITEKNPFKRMMLTTQLLKQNPQWETVHCHTLFSNGFHIYAAYKAGVKQRISHSHNTSDLSKNKWIATIYQFISRKVQQRYSTDFVACGVAAAKFLFPDKNDVLVIPNSIDTQNFANIAEQNASYLKNEFGLDEQTKVILQLGRLNRVKNHAFSFEIVKELKNRAIDFKFFIAGQGELKDELLKLVKQKGLEKEVVFLGLRTDVAELLAGSDLMLMPSLHEGFPVVLVESQASGTPALIADTISSEVDLGVNAVTFMSLNSPASDWTNRMIDIFDQKCMLKDERIRKLKDQGFDIYTNAKKLEEIYSV